MEGVDSYEKIILHEVRRFHPGYSLSPCQRETLTLLGIAIVTISQFTVNLTSLLSGIGRFFIYHINVNRITHTVIRLAVTEPGENIFFLKGKFP